MCMMTGVWKSNGTTKKRRFRIMKRKKKKKTQVKYRAVLYCRVGTPEQLSHIDTKKVPLVVQKDKKVLMS